MTWAISDRLSSGEIGIQDSEQITSTPNPELKAKTGLDRPTIPVMGGDAGRNDRLKTAVFNTGAGAGGELADLGLRTLASFLLARLLGPAGLGVWLLARTVAFDFGHIVARLGLDEGVLRFISLHHGRAEHAAARSVLRRAIIGTLGASLLAVAGILVLAPVLANQVFHKPESLLLMRLIAPSIIILAPCFVVLSGVQAINLLKIRVLAQKVAFPLGQTLVLGAALCWAWGLRGAIAAHYAGIVAMAAVAGMLGLRALRRTLGTGRGAFRTKELLSYSLPVTLAEASNFLVLWSGIIMLGILSTREEVGIYGVALRIGSLVWIPLHAVNQMFSPMIASLHGRRDHVNLQEMFKLTARWVLFVSLPILVVVVVAGRDILSLFGPGFQAGYLALVLVAAGKMVAAATGSVGFMLNMTGRQRLNLLNSIILGIANIVLNYFWIQRWGAVGAAAAAALSLSAVNIMRVVQVRLILGFGLFSRGYVVGLCAAVLGGGLIFLVRPVIDGFIGTVALLSGFLLIYAALIATVGLEPADKEAAVLARRKVITGLGFKGSGFKGSKVQGFGGSTRDRDR